MTEERTYSDFDLVVERSEREEYRAYVVDSPAGEASGAFILPFSELELENLLLRVGRPRRGTRRLESPEMEAAREFGAQLFEAVFQDDLKLTLQRSLDVVDRRDEGLRIRLRLSDTPELASLPWEFLYNEDSDEFLVLSAWTPIVRYLDLTQQIDPLTVTGPLRILVMISGPDDYPALDVEEEWRRIDTSLRPLIDRGAVSVTRAEEATLLNLLRRLRHDDDYHIFHYVGHGGYDEKSDDGVLVLEDENNRSRIVAGRDLGTIIQDHRSLRLAVLNACEGARASDTDPFSGAAQSLVRKGIPAVVAMQFEITDDAAIAFSQEFYASIADGLPVDASVGEARRAIFGLGNDIEWGTPVVYLRGDGQLFDVDRPAAPPVAEVVPVPVEPDTTVSEEPEDVDTVDVDDGPPPTPPPWARRLGALPLWGWAATAIGVVIALVVLVGILNGGGDNGGDGGDGKGDGTVAPTTIPPSAEWEVAPPIEIEGRPIAVAVAADAIWVSSFEGQGLSGINPDTNQVETSIPVGEQADGLAIDTEGGLWVVNRKDAEVWRIDPTTGAVLAMVALDESPSKVAVGEGAVWVVNEGSNTLSQIDPETLATTTFHVGERPVEVLVAEGNVWVSNHESGTVSRVDPSDGSRTDIQVGDGPLGLSAGFDSIWVAIKFENMVVRIDPDSLEVIAEIPVGRGPDGVAAGAGAVWVTNSLDGTVSRIDPEADEKTDTIAVEEMPDGIAVGHGAIWVANNVGGTVSRLEPVP